MDQNDFSTSTSFLDTDVKTSSFVSAHPKIKNWFLKVPRVLPMNAFGQVVFTAEQDILRFVHFVSNTLIS